MYMYRYNVTFQTHFYTNAIRGVYCQFCSTLKGFHPPNFNLLLGSSSRKAAFRCALDPDPVLDPDPDPFSGPACGAQVYDVGRDSTRLLNGTGSGSGSGSESSVHLNAA